MARAAKKRVPKARALKVYRTAIGFHDAYVAAPSMKAALAAWGTDKNLFARGAAELVEDPALTAAPLARPGEVVRVVRGSAAEHVEALGKQAVKKPPKRSRAKPPAEADAPPPPAKSPPPRPSRAALDRAEQAEGRLRERHEAERERIAQRKAALAEEERKLRARQREEERAASDTLDRAKEKFEAAMQAWREA